MHSRLRELKDPNNVLQTANLVNSCTWFHVTCNQDNNVTSMEFFNNDLTGPIPNELGNSINLEKLDLYSNNLTGVIPDTLGKWSQ
ncbi:hypothetical protein AAHE18_16G198700 [Arachis hypogaea]